MNSYRDVILSALLTKLIAAGVVPSGNVYRTRITPLHSNELPAIVYKPGSEKIDIANRLTYLRRFEVRIEAHARATVSTTSDHEADKIIAAISNAIGQDHTLGGLVHQSFETELLEPEYPSEDGIQAMWTVLFTFVYATNQADSTRIL